MDCFGSAIDHWAPAKNDEVNSCDVGEARDILEGVAVDKDGIGPLAG